MLLGLSEGAVVDLECQNHKLFELLFLHFLQPFYETPLCHFWLQKNVV